MGAANGQVLHKPLGLLAEITHRCPLGCPYCSNPLQLERRSDELDAATWARVFREAAGLGVLQVHISGGEPAARGDLVDIVASAHAAPLYTNLITSGVGLKNETLVALSEAGLDHVQISIQDSQAASADHIAGYKGAYARKNALAAEVVRLGLPLTVNMVVHRANIDRIEAMVDLALQLGAGRIEIAHVQYYGWALENRAALMPTREQVERAVGKVEALRAKHHGRIVIDAVVPDYFARFPKPCVGGWGRRSLNVTPSGRVLPCHAAEVIPGLEFWSVRDHSLARHLAVLAGVQRLPRHRLDARALRDLLATRLGLRRLPLPGLFAHGRRARDRPGLSSCSGARFGGRAGIGAGRARLHLSPLACGNKKSLAPDGGGILAHFKSSTGQPDQDHIRRTRSCRRPGTKTV